MRPTKKTALKPCPFCGGKPMMWIGKKSLVSFEKGATDYYIQCSHCGCRTMEFNSIEWGRAKVEAVKRWNRRVEEVKKI